MQRSSQYTFQSAGEDFLLRHDDGYNCLWAKLTDDPSGAKILREFSYEDNIDHSLCLVALLTEKICHFLSVGLKDIKLIVIPGAYANEFNSPITESHGGNPAIVYNILVKPRLSQVKDMGLFATKKLQADSDVLACLQEYRSNKIYELTIHFQKNLSKCEPNTEDARRYQSLIKKFKLANPALNILLDDNTSNDLISDEQWKALTVVFRKKDAVLQYLEKCKQSLSLSECRK